jgi:hypothetical protein
MGKSKVLIKKTKTKTTAEGRLNHKAQVIAGNGQFIMGTPARQHYYNLPELKEALVIAGKALVYEEREAIHNEMIPIFKQYCADNNQGQDTLDTLHLAMDLLLKNFGDA